MCRYAFLTIILLGSLWLNAQDSTEVSIEKDTSFHSPRKATVLSALVPSAGQIFNHLYKPKPRRNNLWWKLPIIYGGLGVATYLAVDYQNEFKAFKQERINRLDPNYISPVNYSDGDLQIIQEQYRTWRDYAIVGGIAVYLLQVIDASIEGHLIHFDTSDDLSIDLMPTVGYDNNTGLNYSFGLRLSFK